MIANLLQVPFRPAVSRQTENTQTISRSPGSLIARIPGCITGSHDKQHIDWALTQLKVQPYQHLLEVGYGSGQLLEEVARTLKIGFLAGIEPSLPLYQQAYRRNKRFIRQQLLQLHIGELHELSYPPHYFHTIYGSDIHLSWKDPPTEFIRLSSLLKSRGRMVMLFRPRSRKDAHLREAAEKIQEDYREVGLTDIRIEYRDLYPATCIAATGYKAE
jgi:cyclopropane fatty-acyl-phospholipid synthase-like methyltransferase